MTIGQNAFRTQAAMAAVLLLAGAAPAWAGASDPYYERAFVVAADQRCDLFRPQLAAALAAATAQARGAALRSGARESELDATAARAQARAGAVSCADPELAVVRGRVDDAFSGWARTPRVTFAGRKQDWTANRTGNDRANWRLVQTSFVGASPVAFGYAGDGEGSRLTAIVSFVGRPRPYAARLILRDPAKSPRPWLAGDGLAPGIARASVWATGVTTADKTLLSDGAGAGEAWRFPAQAADRLEALDPRETFAVEFHFRDGTVATSRFEVGDFAAGRAFLSMGLL